MAMNLYDTYLDRDPRFLVKSKLDLPVKKGSNSNRFQVVTPTGGASTTQVGYSVDPPSESVFIPKKVMHRASIVGTVTIANTDASVPVGTNVFQPGINVCVQSYPLHRMTDSVQTTLNNAQISSTPRNELVPLLQMLDEEEQREYEPGTPIMSDRYARYVDCVPGVANNPFAGYNEAYNRKVVPRGAHKITITNVAHAIGAGGNDNSLVKVNNGDSWVITFQIDTLEPILSPPFVSGKTGDYAPAFLGINQMEVQYLFDATGRRLFSSALGGATTFVTAITALNNMSLLFNYLSADDTTLYKTRIVQDYYHVVSRTRQEAAINDATTQAVQSDNYQLSEIPDLILLYVRKNYAGLTAKDSDYCLPFHSINITFNNNPNLLSNASREELYLMSKRNGLKSKEWYEWSGTASRFNAAYVAGANGVQNDLYTSGGCLVIDPARDLSLQNAGLSNMSGGQFDFSWSGSVRNDSGAVINAELVSVFYYRRLLSNGPGTADVSKPGFNQELVFSTIKSGRVGMEAPNNQDRLMGGMSSNTVARGLGGKSGGFAKSGGKSKLDSLVM